MQDLAATASQLSVWLIPLILAITLHEAAHALAADRLGDSTARSLGRVSLNPIVHIDPLGTLILPGIMLLTGSPFLFGWAKPVPVFFQRLHHPRRDMALVALAGPAMNLLLAFLTPLVFFVTGQVDSDLAVWINTNAINFININIVLAVFNMLPILPMDGGRILNALLPRDLARKHAETERYGILILLGILFLVPVLGSIWGMRLNILEPLIGPPVRFLFDAVFQVYGWATPL